MGQVSESEAVAEFARQMAPFLGSPPATGMTVVEAFVAFCREIQITGAEDAVMLE